MTAPTWFGEFSAKGRTLRGWWALLYAGVAAFFAGWYMYTSGFGIESTESNRGFYLLFTSVLVFLLYPARKGAPAHRPSLFDLVMCAAAVVSVGYWMDQYISYAMFRVSAPNTWDLTMGAICIVVMLETTRRVLGPALLVLGLIFLVQLYYGQWLPGKLSHPGLTVERIIEFTYSTQEAIFGVITATFATFVFPFMVFGAFLERSGAGRFFMDLATALTGRWRGGPAKIATMTSALFGSISGSSVANVVSTGAFTIPLMKRIGFRPHVAGGIEAIASTGGQFMPPIMGAGVFILATLTESSYLGIAVMNIIPATLFFIFVLLMVDLEAVRTGMKGMSREETPDLWPVLKRGWHFFIPLIVIVGLLFNGYSPEVGAFWGSVSALVLSWLRKETRMGPRDIVSGLIGGAHANTAAGAAIGTLGIIIGGIVLSGLGLKFSAVLVDFSGGMLLLAALLVMLISVIIGMGSSTTGSYIILSVVAAPALIKLGVPTIAAHLVVFYAACLSNITPPVCVSAFAAAAIAGSDPIRTGVAALKYGAMLVLLPFSFIYAPGILLYGTWWDIVHATAGHLVGLTALAMALQGCTFVTERMGLAPRLVLFAASVLLLFPAHWWVDAGGLVLFAAGLALALGLPVPRAPRSSSTSQNAHRDRRI
ncbi:TRAP transporter permease [Caenispirillum salinarum]|uniref:TRAP transporter permease n=1 Tax=Caenispirillum salinarum TaxID=859058 RepID=UPI00384BBD00